MCECPNGCCTDPEMADARHGLTKREKLARDEGYGDYMYEQKKDRELEKEMDKEGDSDSHPRNRTAN